jgi:hypothetical protein
VPTTGAFARNFRNQAIALKTHTWSHACNPNQTAVIPIPRHERPSSLANRELSRITANYAVFDLPNPCSLGALWAKKICPACLSMIVQIAPSASGTNVICASNSVTKNSFRDSG